VCVFECVCVFVVCVLCMYYLSVWCELEPLHWFLRDCIGVLWTLFQGERIPASPNPSFLPSPTPSFPNSLLSSPHTHLTHTHAAVPRVGRARVDARVRAARRHAHRVRRRSRRTHVGRSRTRRHVCVWGGWQSVLVGGWLGCQSDGVSIVITMNSQILFVCECAWV
jgi:hypothetical protein